MEEETALRKTEAAESEEEDESESSDEEVDSRAPKTIRVLGMLKSMMRRESPLSYNELLDGRDRHLAAGMF